MAVSARWVVATRLPIMMFLEFFVLGSTMPIFSLYLKQSLGFSSVAIGWVLAGSALSAIVSPLVSSFIVDRYISAERLLSLSHFLAALFLFALAMQTQFIPVFLLYIAYWLILGPSVALTTAITFHHAPQAKRGFGGIRLWGTIGWICAAWVYRLWLSSSSVGTSGGEFQGALQLGIYASVALGVFAFTIPATSKHFSAVSWSTILPIESMRVVFSPQVLILSLFSTVISMADKIYSYGGAPYLKSLGFQDKNIMPALSIGQIPEIFGLALLGLLLFRAGIKRALLLGIAIEILRFAVLMSGVSGPLLYVGISLHGLTYAFIFISASIYLDEKTTKVSRSGAHQLFSFMVGGISSLAGNLLAGFVAEQARVADSEVMHFSLFWLVPLLLSVAGFIGLLLLFKDEKRIT